jgi:hypothetical protein
MKELRVSSWSELNASILYPESGNKWSKELERFASPFVFRGLPNAVFELTPSLLRFRGSLTKGEKIPIERQLLRLFQKYAQDVAAHETSTWNWLALAQHHGLPTRLLDWTRSPYVALHFLTAQSQFDASDGAIWRVDILEAIQYLPQILQDILAKEGTSTFTSAMMDRSATSLEQFQGLSNEDFLVFFEPPSLDARIVNQYAVFSMMPNPLTKLDEWLNTHPELSTKIIVPRELKAEVRDKLDQLNITERMLFPGLDGLSAWLKRHCGHGSLV